MRLRSIASALAVSLGVATSFAAPQIVQAPAAQATTPAVRHVFTIVLENTTWESVNSSTGRSTMPYLHSLESQGVQLNNMHGVGHFSLTNYIAMTSGNAPVPLTQADCFGYNCIYNSPNDANIGDQLEGAGYSWKGYMESMPTPCAHGVEGAGEQYIAPYATRHNPFMYYRDIVSDQPRCDAHDVPFAPDFATDIAANNAPNYSLIVPNTCNDAHDGGPNCGLDDADLWLSQHVPAILASPQYQADGLLLITFDESNISDTRGCCGNAAGGSIYTLAMSPFVASPGHDSAVPYSHYSLLRTVEDAFGLSCLAHACDAGSTALDDDVFGFATNDFSVSSPPVGLKSATSNSVTLHTAVTNGSAETINFSATTNVGGISVAFSPSSVIAGGDVNMTITATGAAQNATVRVLGTSASTSHVVALPVDIVTGSKVPDQFQNGNFETGAIAPWKTTLANPATISNPGFALNSAAHLHNSQHISQTISVDPSASTLRLSWQSACTNIKHWVTVTVKDLTTKIITTALARTCTNSGWATLTASTTAWRGHKVLVTISSHKAVYTGTTTIDSDWDEVSIS